MTETKPCPAIDSQGFRVCKGAMKPVAGWGPTITENVERREWRCPLGPHRFVETRTNGK